MMKDDLLPFIDGFEKGLDAVVASNVIFSTFDNTYPASLSYPICTMLLRENLGFDGLLISNYLDSDVMVNEYRDGDDNLAVMAINAGVDMLMYSDTEYLQEDYNAVLNAVNSGEVSLDRIDEAVIRIILKKNKYDLLDDNHYLPAWNALEYNPENEINIAKKIASECVSLLDGDMVTIGKDEKVLIASPIAYTDLGIKVNDDDENSFAYFLYNKMIEAEFSNVTWQTFDENDSWEVRSIGNLSYDYDKVIFATGSLDWRRRVSFDNNGIVVCLSVPIDISRVSGYISYVAAYGYELENMEAFANCLINGAKINDYRENIEE